MESDIQVLLVDDSEDIRLIARMTLERTVGIRVCGDANNGEEAIAMASSADVIVLDISMPVMDGLTALPILRAQHPRIPVVMLTTTRSDALRDEAFTRGAAAFVDKRYMSTALTAAIFDVCDAGRAPQPV